ncbi:MAG: RluA family pseudouridine synthase [Candidatus Binatia bacterium]
MIRIEVRLSAGAADRADRVIAAAVAGLSRRRAQQLIAEGSIRVDGRRIRKGAVLSGDRVIDIEILVPVSQTLAPEPDLEIPILYQDDACVAVDKPAGRPSHALDADERGTVANFLVGRFPETAAAGKTPLESGLAHRLDTDTSGVLLAARTPEAWRRLRSEFSERRVRKCYLALVHGSTPERAEIDRPIAAHPRSRRRVRVLGDGDSSARGRPAVTRYRAIAQSAGFTLLEVTIETGVMHQIRAHLAASGHPVVGDEIYGVGRTEGAPRQLLHAERLEFRHPTSGEWVRVLSPLPRDFREFLGRDVASLVSLSKRYN